MVGFLKKLMPREDKFFDLFEAHAAKSLEAAKSLAAIFQGGKTIQAHCAALMKTEDEADRIQWIPSASEEGWGRSCSDWIY